MSTKQQEYLDWMSIIRSRNPSMWNMPKVKKSKPKRVKLLKLYPKKESKSAIDRVFSVRLSLKDIVVLNQLTSRRYDTDDKKTTKIVNSINHQTDDTNLEFDIKLKVKTIVELVDVLNKQINRVKRLDNTYYDADVDEDEEYEDDDENKTKIDDSNDDSLSDDAKLKIKNIKDLLNKITSIAYLFGDLKS